MGNLVLIIILLLVGLVLFGRWKDSSVNMMAAAEDSFAMRYFGWRWKTFDFVLLGLFSCSLSTFYFAYTAAKRMDTADGGAGSLRVKVLICIFLLFYASLCDASAVEFASEQRMFEAAGVMVIAGVLLYLAEIALLIVFSFGMKKRLEQMLLEEGLPQRLNGFLCFFFPIVYQYYVIVNAEKRHAALAAVARAQVQTVAPRPEDAQPAAQDDRLDRLRQLAGLKEQGALSEEEFQAEKRRILGEDRE